MISQQGKIMDNELMSVYLVDCDLFTVLMYIGRASHQQIIDGALNQHFSHHKQAKIIGAYQDGRINIYRYSKNASLTFLGHEVPRLENGDYDFVRAVQSQIDSVTAGFILCGIPNGRWCTRILQSMTPEEIEICNDVVNLLFKKTPDLVDLYTANVMTGERNSGGLLHVQNKIECITQT